MSELKVIQTAKKDKTKVNEARYKYFLLFIKDHYKTYGSEISLSEKLLEISKRSLMKYRNAAIKDLILIPKILCTVTDKKGNTYNKTYSVKDKKAITYDIDYKMLEDRLSKLELVKTDWAKNHRGKKFLEFKESVETKKEVKRKSLVKKYNFEKAKISHDLTKYKILNSREVLEYLNKKYPFIKEYQEFLKEFNKNLPDPLKIKFIFKITPTENDLYIQKISIRATNRLCNVLSEEKSHKRRLNENSMTKRKLLKKYGLYDSDMTPNNDTPSSIPRILWSFSNKGWLQEDYEHCCYRQILDRVMKEVKHRSFFDLTKVEQERLRDGFKPIFLSLLFCKNYKNRIRRQVSLKGEEFRNYYNLVRFIVSLPSIMSRECDKIIIKIMDIISEEVYKYLDTGNNNKKFMGIEIFLWESCLEIEMLRELYKIYPDLIAFMQYDSLYINKPYKNFKKLRQKVFNDKILPEFLRYYNI